MLFTVILEFDGVNSVSQFYASGADAAFRKWVHDPGDPNRHALTTSQAQAVAEALAANRELCSAVNEALAIEIPS